METVRAGAICFLVFSLSPTVSASCFCKPALDLLSIFPDRPCGSRQAGSKREAELIACAQETSDTAQETSDNALAGPACRVKREF